MKPTVSAKVTKLILDFGGVIYTISHEKQKQAFSAFSIKNFDDLYSQASQSPLFADLERGHISDEKFLFILRQILGEKVETTQVENAWNSILVGFPDENIRLLEQLQKKYSLYLLSNTNSIHYNLYIREFREKFGYDFNALFEKTFWSFKIGMRKPDSEIFDYLKKEVGVTLENCLFIDDTEINITCAEAQGIPARLLTPDEKLQDLFDEELGLKL